MRSTPATLLRRARQTAGLTQRALARRAGTAQSVVARIERGQTSPSWETELGSRPAERSHMLTDVARILRLSPEQRLDEVRNVSRFVSAARRG